MTISELMRDKYSVIIPDDQTIIDNLTSDLLNYKVGENAWDYLCKRTDNVNKVPTTADFIHMGSYISSIPGIKEEIKDCTDREAARFIEQIEER